MTVREARQQLANKALTFVGTDEGSITHHWIVSEYNKISPLPRSYPMKVTDPWCACFVSVCAKLCGMLDIIPAECGCGEMMRKFMNMGRWIEDDNYHPAIGDIVFYDWGKDTKNRDNTAEPQHVGIVTAVYVDSFVATEGNRSDSVRNITIPHGDGNLRGFANPDYARWIIEHGKADNSCQPSSWAATAWDWAIANGITDGTTPQDNITREQAVTMLHRYHKMRGGN